MATGPTTMNGPLHTDEASLDRKITAYFATAEQAGATREALLGAGLRPEQVDIAPAAAQSANLEPADQTLVGRIREAVLPDDGETATRMAAKKGDFLLVVMPEHGEIDRVIDTIRAGRPAHFDADLERWRNSPPVT